MKYYLNKQNTEIKRIEKIKDNLIEFNLIYDSLQIYNKYLYLQIDLNKIEIPNIINDDGYFTDCEIDKELWEVINKKIVEVQ